MLGYVASLVVITTTGGMLYRYREKIISLLEDTIVERKYLEIRQRCINTAVDAVMHHFERKEKAGHFHVGANHVKLEFDHNGETYQLYLPKNRHLASRQRRMDISAMFDGELVELKPYPGLEWSVTAKQIGADEIWVTDPTDDSITRVYQDDSSVPFGSTVVDPTVTLADAIDTILNFNGGDISFVVTNRNMVQNVMNSDISISDLLKRQKDSLVEFPAERNSSDL